MFRFRQELYRLRRGVHGQGAALGPVIHLDSPAVVGFPSSEEAHFRVIREAGLMAMKNGSVTGLPSSKPVCNPLRRRISMPRPLTLTAGDPGRDDNTFDSAPRMASVQGSAAEMTAGFRVTYRVLPEGCLHKKKVPPFCMGAPFSDETPPMMIGVRIAAVLTITQPTRGLGEINFPRSASSSAGA